MLSKTSHCDIISNNSYSGKMLSYSFSRYPCFEVSRRDIIRSFQGVTASGNSCRIVSPYCYRLDSLCPAIATAESYAGNLFALWARNIETLVISVSLPFVALIASLIVVDIKKISSGHHVQASPITACIQEPTRTSHLLNSDLDTACCAKFIRQIAPNSENTL